MTRLTLLALGLSLLVILALLARLWWLPRAQAPATTRITLEEVTQLSELVTLKVPMHQLVETHLAGYSGGTRCVLLARGSAQLGTDLTGARLEFAPGTRRVQVTLPRPRVVSCAIDQSASGPVFVVRSGLWRVVPGEAGETLLTERAFAQAQSQLRRAAGEPERLSQAKARTEAVLGDWFERQGWDATFRWQPP